jgi:transposase InsO family protein
MPWKESHRVNQRMHFVSRLEAGERMVDLCREFQVSRKTGYKILERYKRLGPIGFNDLSKRPVRHPKQTPDEIRKLILKAKQDHMSWGARKLHEWLKRKHIGVHIPSHSVISNILNREGLIKHRNHRRTHKHEGTALHLQSHAPNEVWCADFKGQFRMGNRNYCYPLTITDHSSRYLLCCEALENVRTEGVIPVFTQVFKEKGIPGAILSDNGPPFGCVGLFGLSQLSVWWMRLGIKIHRIQPGHPEQNGRHERMHLTLKQDTTRPPGANLLQQQERFDEFRSLFNEQRPHEALQMNCPAEFYRPSQTRYPAELTSPIYPLHDFVKTTTEEGRIRLKKLKNFDFYLGKAFAGQQIGFREEESGIWVVTFMDYDLGFYSQIEKKFEPFKTLVPIGA